MKLDSPNLQLLKQPGNLFVLGELFDILEDAADRLSRFRDKRPVIPGSSGGRDGGRCGRSIGCHGCVQGGAWKILEERRACSGEEGDDGR